MPQRLLPFAVSLALVGCADVTPALPLEVSAAELLAAPAQYEGTLVSVEGPIEWAGSCNAAFCEEGRPCNNCWGGYVIGDPAGVHLELVAADEWPYPERTAGSPTQDCYGHPLCEGNQPLGCNGNDLEVHCAPAIPARILAADGRVIPNPVSGGAPLVFEVHEFHFAEGPTEQTIASPLTEGETITMTE